MSQTYTWKTDAAGGEIEADSINEALSNLVSMKEWDELDSPAEQRYLADGSFLVLRGPDGEIVRGNP